MRMALSLGFALLSAGCRPEPLTPLAAAAAVDDVDAVRRLLADGHSPRDGEPLVWAIRRGALEVMRLLLDAGADPDGSAGPSSGWPPVMHAIHTRQIGALRLLLERGADPNRPTNEGRIPLMKAAAEASPDMVTLLLVYGASPRSDGKEGAEVLEAAVSGGALQDVDRPLLGGCHPETVRALLDHDLTLRLPGNDIGWRARLVARLHVCEGVLKLLDERSARPQGPEATT